MKLPSLPSFPWHLFTTRKCRKGADCPDAVHAHTAHLTWVGRWRYTGQKPIFLRFTRLHQVMVVAMALLVALCVTTYYVDGHNWFEWPCAAIDAGLTWLWWHWGVQDVTRREQMAAFRRRWLQPQQGGDQS